MFTVWFYLTNRVWRGVCFCDNEENTDDADSSWSLYHQFKLRWKSTNVRAKDIVHFLTLKAPPIICSRRQFTKFAAFFKIIFHENRLLLADDFHEISFLISFEKLGKMSKDLSSAAVVTGALWVNPCHPPIFFIQSTYQVSDINMWLFKYWVENSEYIDQLVF